MLLWFQKLTLLLIKKQNFGQFCDFKQIFPLKTGADPGGQEKKMLSFHIVFGGVVNDDVKCNFNTKNVILTR
jgi:hypothetical protein